MSETQKNVNVYAALRAWPSVENARESAPTDWEKLAQSTTSGYAPTLLVRRLATSRTKN